MYVANNFERLFKTSINACRDKIMRKSVGKCQTYPKIQTILPSIWNIFALKKSFMSILCCQKPFRIMNYLQHNFLTWVWSTPLSPPLNDVIKLHNWQRMASQMVLHPNPQPLSRQPRLPPHRPSPITISISIFTSLVIYDINATTFVKPPAVISVVDVIRG